MEADSGTAVTNGVPPVKSAPCVGVLPGGEFWPLHVHPMSDRAGDVLSEFGGCMVQNTKFWYDSAATFVHSFRGVTAGYQTSIQ